jgi:uncharacterized membrane protein
MRPWGNLIYNICFALNFLLLFLAFFGANMQLSAWLQVFGRIHPLLLHFPIVLLVLVIVWEWFIKIPNQPILAQVGERLLLFTAFTSSLTALMGVMLANETGYDAENILLHKWSGIAVSILLLTWYSFREKIRQFKPFSYGMGLLSLMTLLLAGHQGADLTHGENFLFAPLIPEKKLPEVLLEDAIVYTHLVKPILEEKCVQCHNQTKAKGDLIMETEELLRKGGKNGKLWDKSSEKFGLLMQRIHLPLENKEHMPPKGKTQLNEDEIKILYFWIKQGANFKTKVIDLPEKDTLRLMAAKFLKPIESLQYSFASVDESILKKLNTDYRIIYPIAIKSPALAVDFFGVANFKNSQITDLQAIKENIVALNLNKMPVKDADLKVIGQFSNLRKLNLAFTQITGANLNEIKKLKELKSLTLSGTNVKAQDLMNLKGMEKLSAIYLWNTQVPDKELISLKKQFPQVHFESGFKGDKVFIKLSNPIIETEKQIFRDKISIKLKHYLKGVNLRYTLDGSEPDSLESPIYKDEIVLNQTTDLKIKAFLKGWQSSEIVQRKFFQSFIQADSAQLLTQPHPKYLASGAKTLQDFEKGDFNFKSGLWLAYQNADCEVVMYFKSATKLSSIGISHLVHTGAHIFPPAQIEVWGGNDQTALTLLKTVLPNQPTQNEQNLIAFYCPFNPQFIKVLKIKIKPLTALPTWHDGVGKPGWIFIDEVFLK